MQKLPRFAWFADPGCGKTIGTLAACDALPMRTLTLAPLSILRSAWLQDAQHFPALAPAVLYSQNRAERLRLIAGTDWRFGITNYDTFKNCFDQFRAAGIRRLVVDESSKIKNPDAAITKKVIQFSDAMDSVILLTGTPAPNSPVEYWPQLRAIRRDLAGDVFWRWAHRYATPQKRKVRVKGGQVKDVIEGWTQTEQQRRDMEAMLGKCSWALRKADCLDLPPWTDNVVTFPLSAEERAAYVAAEKALAVELKNAEVVKLAPEAVLMKVRQIAGGFVIANGTPHQKGRSKLDALGETLDQIGPRPCLIWAEFRHEIDAIVAECRARGESVATIDGRTSHDAGETAARFQRGEILRLVCHAAAAGHGITLTRASYAVYYSWGFSFELWKQSRDRIHRAGQVNACTYYILCAEQTVDESALRVVRGKGKASDAILDCLARGAVH